MVALSLTCTAQEDEDQQSFSYGANNSHSFSRHSSIFSLSIGTGLNTKNTITNYIPSGIIGGETNSIPFYIKYEHGIVDEVGIGAYFSHGNSKSGGSSTLYSPTGETNPSVSTTNIGVLGYYHFNKLIPVRHLDVYAGLGFAIRNHSFTNAPDPSGSDFLIIAKAGVRYYIVKHFGIFAELSADGMSPFNIGVSLNTWHLGRQ